MQCKHRVSLCKGELAEMRTFSPKQSLSASLHSQCCTIKLFVFKSENVNILLLEILSVKEAITFGLSETALLSSFSALADEN